MDNQKKIINAWCFYDWANSAFATTIIAAVLPVFFRKVSAAMISQSQLHMATSIWAYTSAAAMLIAAVLSLILGTLADYSSSKKKFLGIFAGLGILSTFFIALTGPGNWLWVALLYILASIGFAGGDVFYNSMLPHIASHKEIDRISTKGYAMGYLGGGLLLAINVCMIYFLPKALILPGGSPVPLLGMQLSFVSVSIWWGFFSIPLFRHVPEPDMINQNRKGTNPFEVAFKRLSDTFRNIRCYKQLFLFIIAFWFYNDGIGTIIKMATIYGDEIGIGTLDLIGALLLTQFTGIPFSLLFGKIAGSIGAKRSILIGLGVYLIISIGGFFMYKAIHFWILAFMVGLVQGGTQALSRSLYGAMVPKKKSAEFFSFYNISGKFAGVCGPVIFGLVSQFLKTSRMGILSLVFFFVIGGVLLLKVDVQKGMREVENENRGN
jgi:UMF1 family MFS transporter